MSVYVTVNPLCMRREKTILSDREQIKKFERERRRRLRIEQVRQQSKDISSNLLERTKDIANKEINNLEKNQDSDLRRLHNKKINEIQQRYQDEMNNIGLAHESASIQPQSQIILEAEKYKNHMIALERGKEATHLINTKSDNNSKHQRLKQVREAENLRSAIIAGLPKTKCRTPVSIKKKKKIVKKSPVKTKIRSPQQVTVEVHQEEPEEDVITDFLCLCNDSCTCPNSDRPSDNIKYNPEDYRQRNHVDLIISTTSVSDDSSYFSDIPAQISNRPATTLTSRRKNTQRTTLTGNKSASDFVERIISIEGEVNAEEEAARQVVKEPPQVDETRSRRWGADALLREKVKRDYNNLIKNLDILSKEERKLKASRIDFETKKFQEHRERDRGKIQAELRNKRIEKARQKLMDRDFDDILPVQDNNQLPERIITLPRKEINKLPIQAHWSQQEIKDPQEILLNNQEDKEEEEEEVRQNLSRDEQILKMLKKVERQKKLLLQEFGTSLPNEIFDASMTPLFNNINSNQSKIKVPQPPTAVSPARQASPEIKVINLSNVSDDKRIKLRKEKNNKKTKASDKSEIAVQTSRNEEEGKDKSVQVEMSPDKFPRLINLQDPVNSSDKLEYVEPVVTIITHPDIATPTDERSRRSIVINVGNGKIQVTSPSKNHEQVRSLKVTGKDIPSTAATTATAPSILAPTTPRVPLSPLLCQDTTTPQVSLQNNQSQPQSNRKYEKSPNENISQSSSSYASLGAINPSLNISLLSNITSILELLDLSENNNVGRKLARFNISPASTPETPSPRIINMRSNRPSPKRIAKILEFTGLSEQIDTGDTTLMSQSHNSSPYTKTRYYIEDALSLQEERVAMEAAEQSQLNQQKNKCMENLQVINALLNQHRSQAVENTPTNLDDINQLIKAVDDLRLQISPTVHESRERELNTAQVIPEADLNDRNTISFVKPPVNKPRIVNNEPANIDIQGWRKNKGLKKPTLSISNDEVVAKLSQEILEQSKQVKGFKKKSTIKTEQNKDYTRGGKIIPVITLDDDNGVESHTRNPLKSHNLSTIEELDTPDTGNQSQRSVRSPGKLIKVLTNTPQSRLVIGNELNTKNNVGISVNLGDSSEDAEKKLEKPTPEKSRENLGSISSLGILSIPSNTLLSDDGQDEGKALVPFSDNPNAKSVDSLLIHCSTRNSVERINGIKSDNKITSSSSSNSFSGLSGISDILTTPVSDTTPIDVGSPPEKMEDYLMGLGLASLIPILRKTRKASALSSSSNSDITIALKRVRSPLKKSIVNNWTLPGFSDVSSISIKETTTNKSTEKTVLMKARTSTPNIPNYYSLSEKSSLTTTTSTTSSTGGFSLPEHSDSVIATNLSVYLKT